MWQKGLVVAVALGVAVLAGCRSAPIKEVVAEPIVSAKPLSAQAVESAIVRAGAGLGWRMVPQGSGKIVGTLALRTHLALIDVAYDTKTYSIRYKDSSNLDYTGTSIHNNYNGWIENLDKAIRAQLATS
jgi:hypothetical protein